MSTALNAIEVNLFLSAIKDRYGYDFTDYARTSLVRRLISILEKYEIENLAQCQHRIIHDVEFFKTILNDMTITVSDLFRDPHVYVSLKKKCFPLPEATSSL